MVFSYREPCGLQFSNQKLDHPFSMHHLTRETPSPWAHLVATYTVFLSHWDTKIFVGCPAYAILSEVMRV